MAEQLVHARLHLLRALAAGTAVGPQVPARAVETYLRCGEAFVVAVVPFEQAVVDLHLISEAGQPAGLARAFERRGQDAVEAPRVHDLGERAPALAPGVGERQ